MDNIVHYLGSNPSITKEEFLRLWAINPQGDPEKAYIATAYAIKHEKTFLGESLNLELLIEKYQKHVSHAINVYGDPKYVVRLENWIAKRKFNEEFGTPTNPNSDRYV